MATYRNPPAAISYCKAQGACSPGELYSCAIGIMPRSAPPTWAKNVRRLVADAGGNLCGALGRRPPRGWRERSKQPGWRCEPRWPKKKKAKKKKAR